ncbi:MAG: HNH endonuclease [Planctomycetaceae bacterium]|nr:HNH endonuclease [Planctomycetaceae bacterium]
MTRKHKFQNTLYTHDNLYVLSGLNSGLVDLIYLDPPFNSKRMYSAPIGSKAAGVSFKDMWTWEDVNVQYLDTLAMKYPELTKYIATVGGVHGKPMMAYLTYMAQRIVEMHRILKDTGSLYLHCDPTASHYLKILLDFVFGKNNFRNEIVWCYKDGANSKKNYNKKHDVILFYTKGSKYTFNYDAIYRELSDSTVKKYRYEDENGKYRLMGRGIVNSPIKSARDINPKWEKTNPELTFRHYLKGGALPLDWFEMPPINQSAKERTGYPTQKPLALLHRIIKASSKEGDIVMDPFCGCATTCVAAQQLGRKWIGIDIEQLAVRILIERLSDDAGLFKDFIATELLPVRTDVKREPKSLSVKQRLYKEQNGKCNACGVEFEIRNLEIDHIQPSAKGGGDYYENYQLLCSSCNKIKGDRTMEYVRMKLAAAEALMKNKIIFGE